MTGLYVVGGIILLVVGVIVAAYMKGKSAGADKNRADLSVKTADTLKRQGDAIVNAPQGKDAVVDRLRNGGGL